jgi:type IV secretory pathway protease TraF
MPVPPPIPRFRLTPGRLLTLGFILGAAAALLFVTPPSAPLIVYIGTPSVPIGFYRLTAAPIAEGRLVLFPPPAGLLEYQPFQVRGAHGALLMKPVIATAGRVVCAGADGVTVADRGTFPQDGSDSQGRPLPQYRDCRPMEHGEAFVLSDRVPRSLDSRYFGPVNETTILGVYVPLWTPRFFETHDQSTHE